MFFGPLHILSLELGDIPTHKSRKFHIRILDFHLHNVFPTAFLFSLAVQEHGVSPV
jgi:hypothetical protein